MTTHLWNLENKERERERERERDKKNMIQDNETDN